MAALEQEMSVKIFTVNQQPWKLSHVNANCQVVALDSLPILELLILTHGQLEPLYLKDNQLHRYQTLLISMYVPEKCVPARMKLILNVEKARDRETLGSMDQSVFQRTSAPENSRMPSKRVKGPQPKKSSVRLPIKMVVQVLLQDQDVLLCALERILAQVQTLYTQVDQSLDLALQEYTLAQDLERTVDVAQMVLRKAKALNDLYQCENNFIITSLLF